MPQQMRKIGPTRRSVSGIYAFRGETQIVFESTLERDFLIRFEFFNDVLDIIPQPVQIPYRCDSGRSYTYTPDYLVYYRLGNRDLSNYPKPLLVEVKPKKILKKNYQKWITKWKTAAQYAREQGWKFKIFHEDRIRDQVFDNIRFLERYKRMLFPEEENHWVINNIYEMGSSPFHYILSRHFMGIHAAEGISHIWHLLATRRLDCDISQPLNDFTELWVPSNE